MRLILQKLKLLNPSQFFIAIILSASLMIIGMHIISVWMLHLERKNTLLVEIAQKQKLLSQQIVKTALLIEKQADPDLNLHLIAQLKNEWSEANFHFKYRDEYAGIILPRNETIAQIMLNLQPHEEGISDAVDELLMVAQVADLRAEMIDKLCKHEVPFSHLMDEIVTAYRLVSGKNTAWLGYLKVLLLLLSFSALILLLLLSSKILINGHFAYTDHGSDKEGFFSEKVADDFLKANSPGLHSAMQINIPGQIQKHNRHKAKILVIKHKSIPMDYLAWFLNRWEIDFSIVQDKQMGEAALKSGEYDMVMMSQSDAQSADPTLKHDIFHVPIVIFEPEDIDEIHKQIYEDHPHIEARFLPSGNLYNKIEKHIPRDKLSV